jgi:hypothetical protein
MMPKADRGMAQRYAAKRRRRRPASARSVPVSGPVRREPLEDEPHQAEAGEAPARSPGGPSLVARAGVPTVRIGGATARTRPAVRPFSAYAQEYTYVANDLRRVTLVGGGLLVALIVLSFFVH